MALLRGSGWRRIQRDLSSELSVRISVDNQEVAMSGSKIWFDTSSPTWEQDYGCSNAARMVALFEAILDSQHTGPCWILYQEPDGSDLAYGADFSLRKEILFEPHRTPDGMPVFVLCTRSQCYGDLRFIVSKILKIESVPEFVPRYAAKDQTERSSR